MSVSGKYLAVTINGVDFDDVMDWSVEEESEAVERVTGSTGGFHDEDGGIMKATINVNFVQDTQLGFYLDIAAGAILANLRLWRNKDDLTPAFHFPVARVQRTGVRVQAKGGPVTVPFTAVNKRAYTRYEPSTPYSG